MECVVCASVSYSNVLSKPGLQRLALLGSTISYGVATDNKVGSSNSVGTLGSTKLCNTVYKESVCGNALSLERTLRVYERWV